MGGEETKKYFPNSYVRSPFLLHLFLNPLHYPTHTITRTCNHGRIRSILWTRFCFMKGRICTNDTKRRTNKLLQHIRALRKDRIHHMTTSLDCHFSYFQCILRSCCLQSIHFHTRYHLPHRLFCTKILRQENIDFE